MSANPVFTEFLCHSQLRLDAVTASALGAQMWPIELRVDEFLFHQGEPCDHFHIVFDGSVDVEASSFDGRQLLFVTLGPGAPIGEATVVSGGRRTASIRARTDTTLLTIGRPSFLDLAGNYPDLALALARLSATTIRRLSTNVERRAFADLDGRLVALLHDLGLAAIGSGGCQPDAGTAGGRPIDIAITQQTLADRLGVTRESVNKHLRQLVDVGLIEIGRGRVSIIDLVRLQNADDL